jgi:hypothetical protein
VAIT